MPEDKAKEEIKEAQAKTEQAQPINVSVDMNAFMATLKNEYQAKIESLTAELGVVKESIKTKEKSSKVSDGAKNTLYESTVVKPAAWFEQVKKLHDGLIDDDSTVPALKFWRLNVDEYMKPFARKLGHTERNGGMTTEAITFTATDFPQIFDKQVFVLPGGRMMVPVRQFVKFANIPNGADRVNWYKIGGFDVDETTAEGTAPAAVAQTVTKIQAVPVLYRELQVIGYAQIESSPFSLIEAVNQAAVIGANVVENKAILETAPNAATPGLWIRGDGTTITSDDIATNPMTQDALQIGLEFLENAGYSTAEGQVVFFAHPKAIRELIQGVDADFFTKDFGLNQRNLAILERRYGIDIVPTNDVALFDNTTSDAYRNLLCIKGHTLAGASAADLQVEADRRPDLSAVNVGIRHRTVGAVFDEASLVRISTKS